MVKLDNWQADLSDLIRKRETEAFDICNFNCLMWACEAIEAQTGEDFYKPFRGKFKTAKGAARVLRQKGKSETAEGYLATLLGEPISKLFIKKGDIVVADPETPGLDLTSDLDLFGQALGVCYGAVSYFVGSAGLIAFPTLSLGSKSYGFHC